MEFSTVKKDRKFCPFCEQERNVFFVRTVQTESVTGKGAKSKQEFFHCSTCGKAFGNKKEMCE